MGDCTANKLMEGLHILMNLLRRKLHRQNTEEKGKLFSFGQYRVMGMLTDEKWMNQRDLCELLDIRPGSLSELLSKLEEAEMIERRPSKEDRRSLDLRLTKKGLQASLQAEEARKKAEVHLFDMLTMQEQETLFHLLQKAIVGLQAEVGVNAADSAPPIEPPGCGDIGHAKGGAV